MKKLFKKLKISGVNLDKMPILKLSIEKQTPTINMVDLIIEKKTLTQ